MIGLVVTYAQAVLLRDALDVVDPEEDGARADREYLLARLEVEIARADDDRR